jgi:branched-chain amino acid transport system ATP-binding protein
MLSISALRAGYGDQEILKGASVSVKPGEIVALIGPNGAGKSTLLKAVFSECDVFSGKVVYKDRDITKLPAFDLIREGIAFVPQGRPVFSTLTVRENLEMGAFMLAENEVTKRNLSGVLEKFGFLKRKLNDYAFTLSGGQQQMLAIARALMVNPQLLLLDEPSLGLAPKTITEVFGLIKSIHAEGVGVLMVEQNARQAVELADRTYVLEDGKIAFEGGKEILQDKRLKNVFFGGE